MPICAHPTCGLFITAWLLRAGPCHLPRCAPLLALRRATHLRSVAPRRGVLRATCGVAAPCRRPSWFLCGRSVALLPPVATLPAALPRRLYCALYCGHGGFFIRALRECGARACTSITKTPVGLPHRADVRPSHYLYLPYGAAHTLRDTTRCAPLYCAFAVRFGSSVGSSEPFAFPRCHTLPLVLLLYLSTPTLPVRFFIYPLLCLYVVARTTRHLFSLRPQSRDGNIHK